MMMGFFHPGTSRGIRGMTMGSLKTVPPRAFRIVPLGDSHTVGSQLGLRRPFSGEHTLLEVEFLDSRLIRSDGSALNTNGVLLDRFCCVDGDLVVGLVPVLQTQIVVLEVNIQIR